MERKANQSLHMVVRVVWVDRRAGGTRKILAFRDERRARQGQWAGGGCFRQAVSG